MAKVTFPSRFVLVVLVATRSLRRVYKTRSQAAARIADRTASQQTNN